MVAMGGDAHSLRTEVVRDNVAAYGAFDFVLFFIAVCGWTGARTVAPDP